MAKDDIRLSPKHGLNPSIVQCFWCGGDNGIALMGKINRADEQAPKFITMNYDPCDKCKEQWSQGIVIMEVTQSQPADGRPPIQPDAYPTGRLVCMKPESVSDEVRQHPIHLMLADEWTELFSHLEGGLTDVNHNPED